jgi:hypothetical protein
MIDWDTLIVLLIGTAFGAILTFLLTLFLEKRETKRKVRSLRRWLYNDIYWIFFDFKTLREMIAESLADEKYEEFLHDANHVDAMLDFLSQLYELALEDDWYKRARAEPHVFAQLSENELRAIDGIHLILSKEYATSKANVFRALLRQEVEKPKDRFELEKAKVERIIGALQRLIKGGLNRDEFLKLAVSQEDMDDIGLMFSDAVPAEKQSALKS